MLSIILEILKIINNRITRDIIWITTSICFLFIGYFVGLSENYYKNIPEIILEKDPSNEILDNDIVMDENEKNLDKTKIFGSKKVNIIIIKVALRVIYLPKI